MVRPTASSKLAAALVAALACGSFARVASADPSEADRALAQSLFDEARKLMDQKDYAHACPKFAESQRLDEGGGTLLNLALCHEAEGKTASAWTEFNDALSRAIRDGRSEREARCRERIAVLAPQLSRLTVSVGADAPPGLELTVDGAAWGAPLRGVGVPLDPGAHVVVAKAPGRRSWNVTVTLGPNADSKTVVVPPLDPEATPSPPPPPVAPQASPPPDQTPARGDSRRTAAWIVGGGGVVALGVGTFFGVRALSKRSDSNADCRPGCTQEGVDSNNQAITAAWVSDVAIGLGIVGVATSAYLLLTSRGDAQAPAPTTGLRWSPMTLSRGGGAALSVAW